MSMSDDATTSAAVPAVAGSVPQPPAPPVDAAVGDGEPVAVLPAPSGWRVVVQWSAEVAYVVLLAMACVVAFDDWGSGPVDYVRLLAVVVPAGVFAALVCRPKWPRERVLLTRRGVVGGAGWARIARVDVLWGHDGRVVRLVLADGTRVPVGMAGTSVWPDKPFVTSLRRLVQVGRDHNPAISVRHRVSPLLLAGLALVQLVAVAGIHLGQREVITPWEPVASGPVPACKALESDGGGRWPGGVRLENDNTPDRELRYCTWGFTEVDDVADGTWLLRVEVDMVAHRWRPTSSPVAAAMYRYDYDHDAMLAPEPLPGVGDEASITMHVHFVEVIARRANLTLVLRLYYAGKTWPARAAATAIAAETLHGVRLRSVLNPVRQITQRE
jgi:hypothetical protein